MIHNTNSKTMVLVNEKPTSLDSLAQGKMNGNDVKIVSPEILLSCYLDRGHGFVRIKNAELDYDYYVGKYPRSMGNNLAEKLSFDITRAGCKVSGMKTSAYPAQKTKMGYSVNKVVVPSVFVSSSGAKGVTSSANIFADVANSGNGVLLDEFQEYEGNVAGIPHVDFPIDSEIAEKIIQYIDGCFDKGCSYYPIGDNCLDFIQEIFSMTPFEGHFSDYFSSCFSSKPEYSYKPGVAPAYAFAKAKLVSMIEEGIKIKAAMKNAANTIYTRSISHC